MQQRLFELTCFLILITACLWIQLPGFFDINYDVPKAIVGWQWIIWGGYYGFMLVMAVYSILNGLIIKDRLFFFYSMYVVSLTLLMSAVNQHGFIYFWADFTQFSKNAIPLMMGITMGFGTLFGMSFLSINRSYPRLKRLGYAVIAASVLLAGLSFMPFFHVVFAVIVIKICFSIVIMLFGIQAIKNKFYLDWYFFIGWSVVLLGGILFTLTLFGVLPLNHMTFHFKEVASVFQVLLFSLGMSAIYHHEKEECRRVDSALLAMRQRLRSRINMVRSQNGQLDIPVLERHLPDIEALVRNTHREMGRLLVMSAMVMDRVTGRSDSVVLGDCLKCLIESRLNVFPFHTRSESLQGEVTVLIFSLHNKFEAEAIIHQVEQWKYDLDEPYQLHFGYTLSHEMERYPVDYIEESLHYLEEAVQRKDTSYTIDGTLRFLHRDLMLAQ